MHKIGCFLISLWDITLTLTRPLHFTSKIGVNLGLAVGIALWFSHSGSFFAKSRHITVRNILILKIYYIYLFIGLIYLFIYLFI